jgi:predicted glutamine amidotransferase
MLYVIGPVAPGHRLPPGTAGMRQHGRLPPGAWTMCRWLAYAGSPILLEELLYKPAHSLIDQSRHARLGKETTNGDGFGVAWYGDGHRAAMFRGIGPAWGNRNLRELASHVRSPLFLAHVRSSTGTPVQESNCHPFRHDRWLWMHNGMIVDFLRIKRDLVLAVDPALYASIEGSTDSEVMFYLALTLGLYDDPPGAVERMVGLVEATGRQYGIAYPIQMTVAASDGERLWAFRYSSEHRSRSLFYSTDMHTLHLTHPDNPNLRYLSDESRLVVSEPLGDLAGGWNEVPESSVSLIHDGRDEIRLFRPRPA